MKFDGLDDFMEVNDSDLQERLSSWRRLPDVVQRSPESVGEAGINEAHVRQRERRAASMCLITVKEHDSFLGNLKAHVEQGGRDTHYQKQVEDMAAFALGVFEQFSAENLHEGLKNELGNLPKEVIQTVTVPAPQPPRSWFQRVLGI
jgi:hypothetical protein